MKIPWARREFVCAWLEFLFWTTAAGDFYRDDSFSGDLLLYKRCQSYEILKCKYSTSHLYADNNYFSSKCARLQNITRQSRQKSWKNTQRRSLELYFARFSCSWNQENKYHHSNAVTECLEFNFGSIGLTDLKIFSRVYLDTTRRPYEFNLKKIHLPHRAPPKILKDVLFLSFIFQACSNLLIVEMQILLGSFKLSQKEIKTTSAELHCINNIVFKRIIALNEGAV